MKKCWLLALTLVVLIPSFARADAIALGTLGFSGLTITAVGGGTITLGSWETFARANADNSLGQSDSQFGSADPEHASATVTWANGIGDTSVVPPTASGTANVNIPGCQVASASSSANSSLLNFFTITGGTGPVDVVFSVDLSGSQSLSTDLCGVSAASNVVFHLALDADDPPFADHAVLFYQHPFAIGQNASASLVIGEHLTNTLSLLYGTEYQLEVFADTDSVAITKAAIISAAPEPATGTLLITGIIGVVAARRRRQG